MLRPTLVALTGAAAFAFAGAAHSAIFVYADVMSGANEAPPNASPAIGHTTATVDNVLNTLAVMVDFSGLIGGPGAAAHIHCCTSPGTNIIVAVPFTGFPAATSGSYSHTFDLTDAATYNGAFLTASGGTAAGAEAALLAGLAAGLAYSNIHNAQFPGGEIRGFLTSVPEPATWALLLLGFGAMGAGLRRRRTPIAA